MGFFGIRFVFIGAIYGQRDEAGGRAGQARPARPGGLGGAAAAAAGRQSTGLISGRTKQR